MRIFLAAVVLGAWGCASVKPLDTVASWKRHDHKTLYAVRETDQDAVYLTVKYSPFTFMNRTRENVPAAEEAFKRVAVRLARERGYRAATTAPETFYVSTAHDASGISTVLVSNDVHFEGAAP